MVQLLRIRSSCMQVVSVGFILPFCGENSSRVRFYQEILFFGEFWIWWVFWVGGWMVGVFGFLEVRGGGEPGY